MVIARTHTRYEPTELPVDALTGTWLVDDTAAAGTVLDSAKVYAVVTYKNNYADAYHRGWVARLATGHYKAYDVNDDGFPVEAFVEVLDSETGEPLIGPDNKVVTKPYVRTIPQHAALIFDNLRVLPTRASNASRWYAPASVSTLDQRAKRAVSAAKRETNMGKNARKRLARQQESELLASQPAASEPAESIAAD